MYSAVHQFLQHYRQSNCNHVATHEFRRLGTHFPHHYGKMDAKENLKPKPKDIVECLMTFEGKETKKMKDKTGAMVEKVYLRYRCPNENCQVGVIAFLDKSGFKNPLSHLKVCYSRGLESNAQEEKLLKMFYEIKGIQPNSTSNGTTPDARPSTVLPFKEYNEATVGNIPKLGRISFVRRSSENEEEGSCTSPTGATGNGTAGSEGRKRARQENEDEEAPIEPLAKMKWELQVQQIETERLRKEVKEQSGELRKISSEVEVQKKETQELKDILSVVMYDLNKERASRKRALNS